MINREGFQKIFWMKGFGGVMGDLQKLSANETATMFEEHAKKITRDEKFSPEN